MTFKLYKKKLTTVLIIVIVVSAMSVLFILLNNQETAKVENITVSIPALEQNALIYVAKDQGFFTSNGLNVSIKSYDSGVPAINDLLAGSAEIAETAEFPVVNAALDNKSLSIVAVNDKFENDYIIGLKSHGVEQVSDLNGKTIGVAKGTIAEFYLGRYLELNGIRLQDTRIINVTPSDYVNVIANGTVDALVAWQPYINLIQNQIDGIVTWQVQFGQPVYGVIICNNEWLLGHINSVESFLKALGQAQDYILNHPDYAKAIVQRALNYSGSYITAVWPQHSFLLSLDQSLVTAMRDEAQWVTTNHLTNETQIPNFADYIYPNALRAVKPEAVTLTIGS